MLKTGSEDSPTCLGSRGGRVLGHKIGMLSWCARGSDFCIQSHAWAHVLVSQEDLQCSRPACHPDGSPGWGTNALSGLVKSGLNREWCMECGEWRPKTELYAALG